MPRVSNRAVLVFLLLNISFGQKASKPPPKSTDFADYPEIPSATARDCPLPKEILPPVTIKAGDFVELSRSGCFGPCPVYTVRVQEDGRVTWNGKAFVKIPGEKHANIGRAAAHTLLQKFQSAQFWKLCNLYDGLVTDSVTVKTTVQVGGLKKTVSNYANAAPPQMRPLQDAIDAAADTHLWRNGAAENSRSVGAKH